MNQAYLHFRGDELVAIECHTAIIAQPALEVGAGVVTVVRTWEGAPIDTAAAFAMAGDLAALEQAFPMLADASHEAGITSS